MKRTRFFVLPWLLLGVCSTAGPGCNVTTSAPGGEETVAQTEETETPVVSPASSLDRLRLAWNAESTANWPAAEVLATISKLAYLDPADAQPRYQALGFEQIQPLVFGSLGGYVLAADDVAVIVFRGTDSTPNWLIDLEIMAVGTPQGDIHEGFFYGYQSLKSQIVDLIAENRPKHLWITGHSLGGALAVVCAYDLAENEQFPLTGIMTFGQPMIADKQLAGYLNTLLAGRFAHFVNETDIVPRVAPEFCHCGSLVWFTDGGIRRSKSKAKVSSAIVATSLTTSETEIEPLSAQQFQQVKAGLQNAGAPATSTSPVQRRALLNSVPAWIGDHAIDRYLEKIQNFGIDP